MQTLEARLAAVENAARASDVKTAGEITAVHSQFSQLGAQLERLRGEADARVGEASARASSQYDSLVAQLGQAADERTRLAERMATKEALAEAQAIANRRAAELTERLEASHTQWRATSEAVDDLQGKVQTLASLQDLERLSCRAEAIGDEVRSLVRQHADL